MRPTPSGKKSATAPTEFLNSVPTITNADTLGIRPDLTGRAGHTWADLLSPDFKGKAALQDNPTIGVIDVAMAIEARGDIKYGNKGNMTKEEIDKTIALMTQIKQSGQFRSFWASFDQSVNLMASGEVVIQSMWSPAVTAVRTPRHPLRVPAAEGRLSRLGLSFRHHEAPVSGLQARLRLRIPELVHRPASPAPSSRARAITRRSRRTRENSSATAEWDYWYGGKPAAEDIKNPFGKLMEKAGRARDGGSFERAHGQHRGVELGDGRGPLPDPSLERVHHACRRRHGERARASCVARRRR